MRAGLSRFLFTGGGLVALTTLLVYVWVAPTHIVDPDNAEFATLGFTGGTAHPSGYPLYLMWLRVMQWLPGESPAHVAAIATAIIGTLGVLVLHAACRAWGAKPLGATLTVAAFATAPIVMRISTEAEVFALNALVVSTVLWIAATGGPLVGARRAAALGLIAGLGLANHMTCTLVAPLGLLGVVRGAREAKQAPLAIGAALGGLLVGLLPYLYLLATPDTPLSWGKVDSFADLVHMVTRGDYGTLDLVATGASVSLWTHLEALAAMLGRTWLFVGAIGGLAMLGWRIVRPASETRWGWSMLAASFVIAGPLLLSRFNLAPTGLSLFICNRFHVLPALLLAIPIAVALAPLDSLVERTRLGVNGACAIAATAGFVALTSATLPRLSRTHAPAIEYFARNTLAALPPNAVLFDGTDDQYFGIGYAQWALGLRQDVVVVAPQLAIMPWYRARIAARGVPPDVAGQGILSAVEKLVAEGRPVFVEKSHVAVIGTFTTYPFATLMRVLPRGAATPPIDQVVAENEAIYERFVLPYARPGVDDEFVTFTHERYAGTWTMLGRKLTALGQPEKAARAFAIARAIGPHE